MPSHDGFTLDDVVSCLRGGPPELTAEEASRYANANGWQLVADRSLEVAIELSLQSDDDSSEGWTSFRSRQIADVRDAVSEQLGPFRAYAEGQLSEAERNAIYRVWKTGLRVPEPLREELETDFPCILAVSQLSVGERRPGVELYRILWKAYASGMMPIGWNGCWPEGELIVAYFA